MMLENFEVLLGLRQSNSIDFTPAVAVKLCGSGTPGNPFVIIPAALIVEYSIASGSA